jgi:hypothetical protein
MEQSQWSQLLGNVPICFLIPPSNASSLFSLSTATKKVLKKMRQYGKQIVEQMIACCLS